MKITIINSFLSKVHGRIFCVLLSLAILNLNSCTIYKAAPVTVKEISENEQVINNLDVYHFFVHTEYSSYELNNVQFLENGDIKGEAEEVTYEQPDSSWNRKERKAYWQDHKYDINIYCASETALSNLSAGNDGELFNEMDKVILKSNQIERMTITSIDKEEELSKAALAVLIIVGVVVGTFLIILLTTLMLKASSDDVQSSSDSGGSNSGSDGSSDGSSGSSDSGSGSGSSG